MGFDTAVTFQNLPKLLRLLTGGSSDSSKRFNSKHYETGGLYQRIISALQSAGKNLDAITVEDLPAVDEFHIGGIQATNDLLDQLDIGPETRVLDIGSGLGAY